MSNRRTFLKSAAAGVGLAGTGSLATSCTSLAQTESAEAAAAPAAPAASAAPASTPPPPRQSLDFTDPQDNLYGFMKLFGDISGKRTYNYQPGRIYAYRDGQLPKHILDYAGVTLNEVRPNADGTKYTIRFTGAMLMQKPGTLETVDTWENPITSKMCEVSHFSTDRGKRSYGVMGEKRPEDTDFQHNKFDKPFIMPWEVIGDNVWAPHEVFWIYTDREGNPRYEAAIQTYQGSLSELEDRSITNARSTIASQSQSPFFPWMGGLEVPGHMILTSHGYKMDNLDLFPDQVLEDIEKRFPGRLDIEFPWEEGDTA